MRTGLDKNPIWNWRGAGAPMTTCVLSSKVPSETTHKAPPRECVPTG